jgi:hypothetical protein
MWDYRPTCIATPHFYDIQNRPRSGDRYQGFKSLQQSASLDEISQNMFINKVLHWMK